MSDRANELRRQRDLLRENLAWIEREIAAEEGRAATPSPVSPPPLSAPAPVYTSAPADDRDAEAILAEYRTPAMSMASKTKMGCVVYFVVAMVILVGAMVAFYFYIKASRGH